MKRIWEKLFNNLAWGTVTVFLVLALIIFVYDPSDFAWPYHKALKDLLVASLTGILGAFVVGLLFKKMELDKMVGKENVKSVLGTVFDPEERIYGLIRSEELFRFSCISMAASEGIHEGDDNFGLVKTCLEETQSTLKMPYQKISVHRSFTFDPRIPDFIRVDESVKMTYTNNSCSGIEGQKAWRIISTPEIKHDYVDGQFDIDHAWVRTSIIGDTDIEENSNFPTNLHLSCKRENGEKIWENPDDNCFTVPAKCEGFEVETIKTYYISINDRKSEYAWMHPIRSLSYSVDFNGIDVEITPMVTGCPNCVDDALCARCAKGIAAIGQRENGVSITISDWAGRKTGVRIEWKTAQ